MTNAEFWDEYCKFNIKWIGSSISGELTRIADEKEDLNYFFSTAFRFLVEAFFSTSEDMNNNLQQVWQFVINEIDEFDGRSREQIKFALYELPIRIMKFHVYETGFDTIADLQNVVKLADQKKEEWDKELESREIRVNALKDKLTEYETAYNFVGIYQGFDEMSSTKVKEINHTLTALRVVGVLILIPFIIEAIFIYTNIDRIETFKTVLLLSTIPILSITAILVYYFRVILFNYNAVKSQLLQIELRKTLCQFIQSYVDYSKEMKKDDKESLAKFENIIFSSLVSSDDKLPSTYDGLEQIANLIKSIKN